MGFECQDCKIYYKEKPTHTTTCKYCMKRLVFVEDNLNNFKIEGVLHIDNSRCVGCGGKFVRWSYIYVLKNHHQNSEFSQSRLVHSKCYNQDFNPDEKKKYVLSHAKIIKYKDFIEEIYLNGKIIKNLDDALKEL